MFVVPVVLILVLVRTAKHFGAALFLVSAWQLHQNHVSQHLHSNEVGYQHPAQQYGQRLPNEAVG
jgi:hypothetical protein